MALLALFPLAWADPFVLSVGDEVPLSVGGTFARTFPREDGSWDFFWGANSDYAHLPMTSDLVVTDRDRDYLSGWSGLVDHAIARCPDGSFLHAASLGNESGAAFRYSPDLALVGGEYVEQDVSTRAHNDPTVLCSPEVQGVFFSEDSGADFFPIDAEAHAGEPVHLEGHARMTGGSAIWEPETQTFLTANFEYGGALEVARYDTSLALVDSKELDFVEAGERGYWAQGLVRVGDYYLLAHMQRNDAEGWASDEGNVWLRVFDLDWNLVESHELTANTAPNGGMRPFLARNGDTLVMLYDKQVQPRAVPVTLDLLALGYTGEDTAADDTGGATEDGTGDDGTKACGCAATGPSAGVVPIAWLFLAIARRRGSAGVEKPGRDRAGA